jgi:hypothetical protein
MKYNSIFRKMLAALIVVTFLTGISAAGNNDDHKVTICHKHVETIEVSQAAWPAHLNHGDTKGPCATPPAPSPELSTTILMSTGLMGLIGFSRLKRNY